LQSSPVSTIFTEIGKVESAVSTFETTQLPEIGKRIRNSRLSAGLNLHELARLSGISAPALSLIENGKRDLRLSSLFRIAGALRIEATNLLHAQAENLVTPDAQNGSGYNLGDYQ
jgi:transcriptional regulator with XRE-family HTH domain